jgi:hypothetical protein
VFSCAASRDFIDFTPQVPCRSADAVEVTRISCGTSAGCRGRVVAEAGTCLAFARKCTQATPPCPFLCGIFLLFLEEASRFVWSLPRYHRDPSSPSLYGIFLLVRKKHQPCMATSHQGLSALDSCSVPCFLQDVFLKVVLCFTLLYFFSLWPFL